MPACTLRAPYTRAILLVLFSWLLLFSCVPTADAEGCGDLVYPSGYYYEDSEEERHVINNCDNPFWKTGTLEGLVLNGQAVTDGGTYVVGAGTSDYGFLGDGPFNDYGATYYLHRGSDYVVLNTDFAPPTEAEIYRLALEMFNQNTILARSYTTIYLADYRWPYFYDDELDAYYSDGQLGRRVEEVFDEFDRYVSEHATSDRPVLVPGTYTVMWQDWSGGPVETRRNGLGAKLFAYLVPTAYASAEVKTVTFTLLAEAPAEPGASSVLFLPGIQASRLYTDGLLGTEDQLWTPTWNQDVRQLRMSETGESIEDVYTRDILDEVLGLGTVYKQFSDSLDKLVTDETIVDWEAYAYDWRYAVDDIVQNGTPYENEIRNVVTLVESLADDSNSGKVTIVAHSNGGLLAKSLMTELRRLGKDNLVDTLILLASPQLGTPKAVGTLLHGFDQEAAGGVVIDAGVARDVIRNMPGAYSLLPAEEYFVATGKEPITFGEGDSIQHFRDAYGTGIDSVNELGQFLVGNGDQRPEAMSIYEAAKMNHNLYSDSLVLHTDILQSWRAPTSTRVIEAVGVGLQTVSSFQYREFQERICTTEFFVETCIDKKYYKPVPVFSLYGDQTVMAQSAKGYQGDKETYFVDLFLQRQQKPSEKFNHANFTELPAVQELVTLVIKNEVVENIPFLSTSAVVQSIEYELISVNSPATAKITSQSGEITEIVFLGEDFSSKKEDIPGSSIYYLGSTTYIVLPTDGEYQIELEGTGTGGVTLVIDSLDEDAVTTKHRVWIPDTRSGMKITSFLKDGALTPLSVDTTGDGSFDYVVDAVTGEISNTVSPVIPLVKTNKTGTKVRHENRPKGTVAGIAASTTPSTSLESYYEQMYILLLKLKVILYEYEKSLQ